MTYYFKNYIALFKHLLTLVVHRNVSFNKYLIFLLLIIDELRYIFLLLLYYCWGHRACYSVLLQALIKINNTNIDYHCTWTTTPLRTLFLWLGRAGLLLIVVLFFVVVTSSTVSSFPHTSTPTGLFLFPPPTYRDRVMSASSPEKAAPRSYRDRESCARKEVKTGQPKSVAYPSSCVLFVIV